MSIAREVGDRRVQGRALVYLDALQTDATVARAHLEESIALLHAAGDAYGRAWALGALA